MNPNVKIDELAEQLTKLFEPLQKLLYLQVPVMAEVLNIGQKDNSSIYGGSHSTTSIELGLYKDSDGNYAQILTEHNLYINQASITDYNRNFNGSLNNEDIHIEQQDGTITGNLTLNEGDFWSSPSQNTTASPTASVTDTIQANKIPFTIDNFKLDKAVGHQRFMEKDKSVKDSPYTEPSNMTWINTLNPRDTKNNIDGDFVFIIPLNVNNRYMLLGKAIYLDKVNA